jgi:hypothetical protein
MPAEFDISPVIEPPAPIKPAAPSLAPMPGRVPAATTPPPSPIPVRKRSNTLLKWVALVAAILFVVSIGSLWWNGNNFSSSAVTIALEAPEHTVSGDEVTYTVRWKNPTGVALTNLRFRIFWPEDTVKLEEGTPTMPESEGFTIDRVEAGTEGTREFKVFLLGPEGAVKTADLNVIFQAGTLKSDFTKDVKAVTTVTDTPVRLTLTAPPTAVAGETVQYLLDARNETEQELTDLRVEFTLPDGFDVAESSPKPSEGESTFTIASLKAGEGTRIRISGTLQGAEREAKTVEVVLKRNFNGQYVDYVHESTTTMLTSPLLSVRIAPAEGREYVAPPGDKIRYTVTYRNNSSYAFLGLSLAVKLEGTMFDLSTVDVENGYFDGSTGTVIYDSSGVPNLSQLTPGGSGTLKFTVTLHPGFVGGAGSSNFFVKTTARLSTANIPTGLEGPEIEALDSLVTKISTQPTVLQSVLYDNGAGEGPMPPKNGEETVFTLRWQITNPGNDVRDAKVTATLPPGVAWKDASQAVVGGTAPTFDQNANRVTWAIGTVPFGTGAGMPRFEALFKVSIRPASNLVGQAVPLATQTTLFGTDSYTQQSVEVRVRDVSTNETEGHSGEGKVQ